MDNQDGNEEMERSGIDEVRRLLKLNRGSTDEQLAAFREELDSAQKSLKHFKTLTEGAVDSGVRLAAEAESKATGLEETVAALTKSASSLSNIVGFLTEEVGRQNQRNFGLFLLSALDTWAINTMSHCGTEEFSKFQEQYFALGTEIRSLIIQCFTAKGETIGQIENQFTRCADSLAGLITEPTQLRSLP